MTMERETRVMKMQHSALLLSALLAALAAGCGTVGDGGPQIAAVTPDTASARGGQTLVVTGSGFKEGAEVLLDATAASSVVWRSSDALEALTPPHVAGPVDVTVRNPDGGSDTLPAGLLFEPLDLYFVEAADHYLPDLSDYPVTDAVAADFDGDAATDLLVAVRNEPSLLLRNSGTGSFVDEGAPDADTEEPAAQTPATWVHDTAAMLTADFDGDGAADVFLCNRAGQPSRIALGDGRGGFALASADALSAGADACRAAAVADMNGDGELDLVVVGRGRAGMGKSYVRLFLRSGPADTVSFMPAAELEPAADVDGTDYGEVLSSPPEVPASYTFTQQQTASGTNAGLASYDLSAGAGSVAFVHSAPPVEVVPDAVELELRGDGQGAQLEIHIVDAEGETFVHTAGSVDWNGWQHLRAEGLSTWTSSGGNEDGVVDLPIESVAVVVRSDVGGVQGELGVDDMQLDVPLVGNVIVEDFERMDFAFAWDEALSSAAVGDLDADGDPDIVLASSAASSAARLRLLINETQSSAPGSLRLREATPGGLATVTERISYTTLLDFDEDGDRDVLAIASDGQDRILVNDGSAFFFDDTIALLPVDRVNGRHAAVADMDLDAAADVLIANADAADRLYLSRGVSGFIDATPAMPLYASQTVRALPLDADGDGDLDVFVLNQQGGQSQLYVSVERPVDH